MSIYATPGGSRRRAENDDSCMLAPFSNWFTSILGIPGFPRVPAAKATAFDE